MKRAKQKMKRAKQKMKIDHKILLILLVILYPQLLFSQKNTIEGLCSDDYRYRRSVDNILMVNVDSIGFSHIPKILNDCYYSKFDGDMKHLIKGITIEKSLHLPNSMYIYTKSPRSGYLYVNSVVSNKLTEMVSVCDSVRYFINGTEIMDCKTARIFLKLKKKDVKEISVNLQDGIWLVGVSTK